MDYMSNISIKKNRKMHGIKAFNYVNAVILLLFSIVCLYPFVNQILLSFASNRDYIRAGILVIPYEFNFESYKYILFQNRIGKAFLISFFVTIGGAAFNMLMTIFGAYALARKNLPGKKIFFVFILITMFFGGGLIPFYLTVKSLGLIDNYLSLVLPFSINTFNMIILRNFFRSVPGSVIESCKIDGGGDFVILFMFVLPLSLAGLATVSLFYIVERWNDWYWPMLFMVESDKFPIALELRNILSLNQSSGIGSGSIDPSKTFSAAQQAATVVLGILPILAIYPFVQKYFIKGVMIGAIKE